MGPEEEELGKAQLTSLGVPQEPAAGGGGPGGCGWKTKVR